MRTFLLILTLLSVLSAQAETHLQVEGIELARPFEQVVADFQKQGYVRKSDVQDATLLLGKFWGYKPTAAVPLRTGDSCYSVMMIVPDPGTPQKLFATYNKVRATVTEKYGIYGKEQNYYDDDQMNDFSPIEDRIEATRYGMASLYTAFQTQQGLISVSIDTHPVTGLGVFVVFNDHTLPETTSLEGITIEENQALEPTRLLGVNIDQPMADVVAELKDRGLTETTSFIERYLQQQSNVTKLRGDYFNHNNCEFTLSGRRRVDVVNVRFPAASNWHELYQLYTDVRLALVNKYGSIYVNTDEVAGVSEQLEGVDNQRALQAIRSGNFSLQTLLLNRYDNHAFKVAITYSPLDKSYHVVLIYYTPQGFARHMQRTDSTI